MCIRDRADDMTVYIVIFDSDSFLKANKLFSDIESYIDDNYAQSHTDEPAEKSRRLFSGKLPDTATTHCFPTAATAHKKAFDDMCVLEAEDVYKRQGQHTTVNTFPGLVHTARQTMRVGNTRSR